MVGPLIGKEFSNFLSTIRRQPFRLFKAIETSDSEALKLLFIRMLYEQIPLVYPKGNNYC